MLQTIGWLIYISLVGVSESSLYSVMFGFRLNNYFTIEKAHKFKQGEVDWTMCRTDQGQFYKNRDRIHCEEKYLTTDLDVWCRIFPVYVSVALMCYIDT